MFVLKGLFQEITLMVNYEEEVGINQAKNWGDRHAEQEITG